MSNIDFYFDEYYGKLYEKAENGEACIFKFESEFGSVEHQFIKREIPAGKLPFEGTYYDIVSPYGYGGPVMTDVNPDNKEKLEAEFSKAFEEYCRENNIVCEFVRFHPIVENALDFKNTYNPKWDRNTLGTNLGAYDDPVSSEFTKHCRKRIRQALNKGVTYEVIEHPTDLSEFKEIYFDTMDRNEAGDFYYFDEEYFNKCIEHYGNNLLLVKAQFEGKTIAAGMYFLYNKWIHIHLSGTRHEYLYLSPAYILRYALTLWGKENGYELIHHGGGRSNDPEDTLFTFKEQFAVNTKFDFYVGRKVWLADKYKEICTYCKVDPDSSYFPAYRQKN